MRTFSGRTQQVTGPAKPPCAGQEISGGGANGGDASGGAGIAIEEIRLAEEIGDESARRTFVEILRRANLRDAPGVEHGDAVGHGQRLGLVVRDVERRASGGLDELPQFRAHVGAEPGVEVRERLVQKQDVALGSQGPCQCDPLLLAAGELGGLARPGPPFRLAGGTRRQPRGARGGACPPSAARTRRSPGRSCAARERNSGRPWRRVAAGVAERSRRGRRRTPGPTSTPAGPQRCEAAWSCRTHWDRAGRRIRRTRPGGSRPARRRSPGHSFWKHFRFLSLSLSSSQIVERRASETATFFLPLRPTPYASRHRVVSRTEDRAEFFAHQRRGDRKRSAQSAIP